MHGLVDGSVVRRSDDEYVADDISGFELAGMNFAASVRPIRERRRDSGATSESAPAFTSHRDCAAQRRLPPRQAALVGDLDE